MGTDEPETRPGTERYTHGYNEASVGTQAMRSAEDSAFFLLPHLKPGMRLIDCGSGSGSITIGLAQAVAPGEVQGVELNPDLVERASNDAENAGIKNVRFRQGNVYDLPFADETFDAAFAHTVLQHLRDPVVALREIRRVLKAGGVIGVREEDHGSRISHPSDRVVDKARALYFEVWERNGGHPFEARRHREWLREAGFTRTEAGASLGGAWGTAEQGVQLGEFLAGVYSDPQFREAAIGFGLADDDRLVEYTEALRGWGSNPDLFSAYLSCHAVGWKP